MDDPEETKAKPNMDMADKVAEKLKASALGELLDDDDLRDLVKKGINKAFFTKREFPKPNRPVYSSETVTVPSVFLEGVVEAFEAIISNEIKIIVTEMWNDPDGEMRKMVMAMLTPEAMQKQVNATLASIGGSIASKILETNFFQVHPVLNDIEQRLSILGQPRRY